MLGVSEAFRLRIQNLALVLKLYTGPPSGGSSTERRE